MTADHHPAGKTRKADYVVRSPLKTDAVGHVLRGAFGETAMPEDLMVLLDRLDRVTH